MSAPSDLLLVQRAAGGDVGAFEMLVRRYQLRVVRLCVRMLGDRHAAEDAAQDVFLVAWRSMGRFRGDAKFSTWLYRIATNRCLGELRRRRAPTLELPEGLAATEGIPHLAVEAAEGLAAVGAAVGSVVVGAAGAVAAARGGGSTLRSDRRGARGECGRCQKPYLPGPGRGCS